MFHRCDTDDRNCHGYQPFSCQPEVNWLTQIDKTPSHVYILMFITVYSDKHSTSVILITALNMSVSELYVPGNQCWMLLK